MKLPLASILVLVAVSGCNMNGGVDDPISSPATNSTINLNFVTSPYGQGILEQKGNALRVIVEVGTNGHIYVHDDPTNVTILGKKP